jgi:D-galactarolactone cycloisomerase
MAESVAFVRPPNRPNREVQPLECAMPKIKDIKLTPLAYPIAAGKEFGMSRGLAAKRVALLTEVVTDDGIVGIGEGWGVAPKAALGYWDQVKSFYLGADLFGHAHVWSRIVNSAYHLRVQNQLTGLMSGIDIAIWDAIGKFLGQPVYKLLGGEHRERVPCYASGGYFSNDAKGQLEHQLEAAGSGYSAYKIKIGRNPKEDVERCRLARRIIGEQALLLVDVNGNYTSDIALESANRIAGHDIHWLEEPVAPEDFPGLERLARRSPIRIASGEAHYTQAEFKRLLEAGVEVLMPDLNNCGGFLEGQHIASLARAWGARVSPHVWGSAIGLAAAIHYVAARPASPHTMNVPFPSLVEYDYWDNKLRTELLQVPIAASQGELAVPQTPGLGISLDPQAVKRFALV